MARPNYGRGIQRLGQLATQYGMMRQQQDYDSWRQNEDIAAREELARLAHENALARDAARITAQNQGRLDLLNETDPMVSAPMPGLPGAGLMPGGGTARLSHLMDAANLDRQNKLLGVQQDREARLGQPEQLPPDYVMYDGYPMPGWRAWQYENPQPGSAGYGGAGGSAIDPLDAKRALDLASELVGPVEESWETDKRTGRKMMVTDRLPGGAYNEAASPLRLGDDIMSAVSDSLGEDQGRVNAVPRVVNNAIGDVERGFDMNLASQMEAELNASFDGWKQRDDGQMQKHERKGGVIPWRDKVKPYSDFTDEIVKKRLEDGTDAVEWRTIEKWLSGKGLSLSNVLDAKKYAELQRQAGINPTAVTAPSQSGGGEVLYDKNGRPYMYGDDGKARYVD